MLTKRLLLFVSLLCFGFAGKSQTLSHFNIVVASKRVFIESVNLVYNDVAYCVDLYGNISPQLFGANLTVNRYDAAEGPDNVGKMKSVGNVTFTYYDRFDGPNNIGKLKAVNNIAVAYYDVYDGFDNIGKLKSIGNAKITYYDRFDISQPTGTVKSIDGDTRYLNIID